MLEKLVEFFKKPREETQNISPEGYCPNCWGTQEYNGEIRKMYEDKQIDVNNHQAHYNFIKNVVVTYIDGIHLKNGDKGWECPTCETVYKQK